MLVWRQNLAINQLPEIQDEVESIVHTHETSHQNYQGTGMPVNNLLPNQVINNRPEGVVERGFSNNPESRAGLRVNEQKRWSLQSAGDNEIPFIEAPSRLARRQPPSRKQTQKDHRVTQPLICQINTISNQRKRRIQSEIEMFNGDRLSNSRKGWTNRAVQDQVASTRNDNVSLKSIPFVFYNERSLGGVSRTEVITESDRFHLRSPLSGQQNPCPAQPRNDNVFVYKIIHDLRHPTELQKNSLEKLIIESQKMIQIYQLHGSDSDFKYKTKKQVQDLYDIGEEIFCLKKKSRKNRHQGVSGSMSGSLGGNYQQQLLNISQVSNLSPYFATVQRNIQEVLEEDENISVVDQRLIVKQSSAFNGFSLLDEPRSIFRKSSSENSVPDKELSDQSQENLVPDIDFYGQERQSSKILDSIGRIPSRTKQGKEEGPVIKHESLGLRLRMIDGKNSKDEKVNPTYNRKNSSNEIPDKQVDPENCQKIQPFDQEPPPIVLADKKQNSDSDGSVSVSGSVEDEKSSDYAIDVECDEEVQGVQFPSKKNFKKKRLTREVILPDLNEEVQKDQLRKIKLSQSPIPSLRPQGTLALDRLLFQSQIGQELSDGKAINFGRRAKSSLRKSPLFDVISVIDNIKINYDFKKHKLERSKPKSELNYRRSGDKVGKKLFSGRDLEAKMKSQQQKKSVQSYQQLESDSENSHPPIRHNNFSMISHNQLIQIDEIWRQAMKERKMLILLYELGYKKLFKFQKTIQDLQMSAQMTHVLLRDLMDYAKLKNQTFKLEKEYFNLIDLTEKAIEQVRYIAKKRRIELEGPVFSNKKDEVYFEQILGDKLRYLQIMTNFLTNAIKFSIPKGTVSILLKVKAVEPVRAPATQVIPLSCPSKEKSPDQQFSIVKGQHWSTSDQAIPTAKGLNLYTSIESQQEDPHLFKVDFEMTFRDTGYGISEEAQKDLFTDFTTLDENRDKNKKGVGLGLSICKDLVLAFGGTINVKSKLNSGTDFIIGVSTTSRISKPQMIANACNELQSKSSNKSMSRIDLQIRISADQNGLDGLVNEDQMFLSNNPKKSNSLEHENIDTENASAHFLQTPSSQKYSEPYQFGNQKKQNLGQRRMLQINPIVSQINDQPLILDQYTPSFTDQNYAFKGSLSPNFNPSLSQNDSPVKFLELVSKSSQQKKPRVLIANDNEFLLKIHGILLEQHFSEITKSYNGRMAVEAVCSHPANYFNMIILDIDMPYMNGKDACIQILEHYHQVNQNQRAEERKDRPKSNDLLDGKVSAKEESENLVPVIPHIYAVSGDLFSNDEIELKSIGFRAVCKCHDFLIRSNLCEQETLNQYISKEVSTQKESLWHFLYLLK